MISTAAGMMMDEDQTSAAAVRRDGTITTTSQSSAILPAASRRMGDPDRYSPLSSLSVGAAAAAAAAAVDSLSLNSSAPSSSTTLESESLLALQDPMIDTSPSLLLHDSQTVVVRDALQNSGTSQQSVDSAVLLLLDDYDASFPRHSDFTVPTSNHYSERRRRRSPSRTSESPPPDLLPELGVQELHGSSRNGGVTRSSSNTFAAKTNFNNNNIDSQTNPQTNTTTSSATANHSRRVIFGTTIQHKYGTAMEQRQSQRHLWWQQQQQESSPQSSINIPLYETLKNGILAPQQQQHYSQKTTSSTGFNGSISTTLELNHQSLHDPDTLSPSSSPLSRIRSILVPQQQQQQATQSLQSWNTGVPISPLTSPVVDRRRLQGTHIDPTSQQQPNPAPNSNSIRNQRHPQLTPTLSSTSTTHHHHPPNTHSSPAAALLHETRHAQSLLLGLAFAALWSSNNALAPNLTQAAKTLGFTTDTERDVYLGSFLSLVVAVASLPLSAGIGIATDHVSSRKQLFVATTAVGAVAALATGHCQTYRQLVLCRWISGGCMTGSVPVAFSFLGDLFDVSERNAASSGLTAMMGMGIVAGQVYAGSSYVNNDWQLPFVWSGRITAVLAVICAYAVQDPVRGGKEKALQDLLLSGQRYDRQLTWAGFLQLVVHNPSNFILLWQGFFSSLPWGAIFVFMNDFLSQDRGFSVPDATYLVAIYGLGCALGGIQGGYLGQRAMQWNRSYLPLFMAITTVLGIVPFGILLNSHFESAHGWAGSLCALAAGWMASLPSVNARPCLLNVNPPESRGAALTAANLLVTLGRGLGPSCITLLQQLLGTSRRMAFNVTLSTFWIVSAGQLLLLMKTLPRDQDAMEAELARYAAQAIGNGGANNKNLRVMDVVAQDNESLVSIEERMISFDNIAAQQTLGYMRAGWQELRSPLLLCQPSGDGGSSGSSSEHASSHSLNQQQRLDDDDDPTTLRRKLWLQQDSFGVRDDGQNMKDDMNDVQWTDETLLVPELPPSREHPDETTRLLLV